MRTRSGGLIFGRAYYWNFMVFCCHAFYFLFGGGGGGGGGWGQKCQHPLHVGLKVERHLPCDECLNLADKHTLLDKLAIEVDMSSRSFPS